MPKRIGSGKNTRRAEIRLQAHLERMARKPGRAEEKLAAKAAKLAARHKPKKQKKQHWGSTELTFA